MLFSGVKAAWRGKYHSGWVGSTLAGGTSWPQTFEFYHQRRCYIPFSQMIFRLNRFFSTRCLSWGVFGGPCSFQSILTWILPSTKTVEFERGFTNLFSRNSFSLQIKSCIGLIPHQLYWWLIINQTLRTVLFGGVFVSFSLLLKHQLCYVEQSIPFQRP